MKRYPIICLLSLVALALFATPAFPQAMGSVKGVCTDVDGKPIPGAIVEWSSVDTGRKYPLKTNNKGEYFSLGISPGKYNVRLLQDGKELWHVNNFPVGAEEAVLDFDLKKEHATAAQGQGMTPEQAKQAQAQEAARQKEQNTVKALNEKLVAANTASQAGDYETAINTLNEANQIDPTRDLIWFRLGDAYRQSGAKQTDPAEKKKRYEMAAADYQKAIELRKNNEAAAKDPEASQKMAAYYNNLAEVLAKSSQLDEAVKAYQQAEQLDPAHTAQYNFNIGAVLTNAGKADDAISYFDKVIAADPTKADAYYWKGVNLIAKETMDKDNKVVAPPGTAEAFQKYLELQPNGQFAEPAKNMLASIGASVETTFGTKKKSKK